MRKWMPNRIRSTELNALPLHRNSEKKMPCHLRHALRSAMTISKEETIDGIQIDRSSLIGGSACFQGLGCRGDLLTQLL